MLLLCLSLPLSHRYRHLRNRTGLGVDKVRQDLPYPCMMMIITNIILCELLR